MLLLRPVIDFEVVVEVVVVQVDPAEVLYCRLYEVAPETAPQLSVAEVEVIDVALNDATVPHEPPPDGGVHPSKVNSEARLVLIDAVILVV